MVENSEVNAVVFTTIEEKNNSFGKVEGQPLPFVLPGVGFRDVAIEDALRSKVPFVQVNILTSLRAVWFKKHPWTLRPEDL